MNADNEQTHDSISIQGFQIIKKLGQGGMASVFLARQESLEREVALKIMTPILASDPSFSERFLREGKTIAQLIHPNIVTIHDIAVTDTHHYISMEFIKGGDLKTRIREKSLILDQIIQIVIEISKALDYAHRKGFIHRDVKPENILFRDDGTSILTDFGIAKTISSDTRMTATGMSIGTLHYMSPEQARVKTLDGRSDLYSLGIVLYEMLTGKVPFDAQDTLAVAYSHVNDPIPPLPAVHASLQPVLDKMLAKDPEKRFSSCGELAQTLEAFQKGTPVPVSRETSDTVIKPSLSSGRPSSNHLLIILILISIGCLAAATWFFWLKTPETASAIQQTTDTTLEKTRLPTSQPSTITENTGQENDPGQVTPENSTSSEAETVTEAETKADKTPAPSEPAQPVITMNAILDIQTTPDSARVFLDNELLGQSPIYIETAPTGEHLLEITHPYHQPFSEQIELSADTVFKQQIDLQPGTGAVTILTDPPGATVFVDDIQHDTVTPVTIKDIKAGEHTIRITLAKYHETSVTVDLEHGQTMRIEQLLEGGNVKTWPFNGKHLEKAPYIDALLQLAEQHKQADRLTRPDDQNALATYQKILGIEPDNAEALSGIQSIAGHYLSLARTALEKYDLASCKNNLQKSIRIDPSLKGISDLQNRLQKAYTPEGRVFSDKLSNSADGPDMVAVLPGSFRMGNLHDDSTPDEKPAHTVTFSKAFAIGRFEITFEQYEMFATATGRDIPDDNSWGRSNRPVINVNWKDATAYTQWLSQMSGHHYRLPSEAEWEYAARAGSKTPYFWGETVGTGHANCKKCGSKWDGTQTAPVGSFNSNHYLLHDVHGNVWEWTNDCLNPDYQGAPTDGSAWLTGNCDERILRGGAWISRPRFIRVSNRGHAPEETVYSYYGFRVVRELQ